MMKIEFYRLYYQYLEYLASIEQIKNKFKFRNDFSFDDWHDWLRKIKSWLDLYKEYEDLNTVRKMKDQFKSMVSTAGDLIDLIDGFLKHRDEFSRKIDPFQYEALYHTPKTELTHEELHGFLGEFKELWQQSLDSLPKIGKGRPPNTHNTRCVNFLLMMFINGSDLEPSCYRSEPKGGQYFGCFYEFITDMLPVLQAKGISLNIKDKSLCDYAVKLIPQRRRDSPYSHIISQIDDNLFQE